MESLMQKSTAWRWLVQRSRESKPFFVTFATFCFVLPTVIGYGIMQFTNSQTRQLEAQLRQDTRPETLEIREANRQLLKEFFEDLQQKDGGNERYAAAMRGQILIKKPKEGILPIPESNHSEVANAQRKPIPMQSNTEASKDQKK